MTALETLRSMTAILRELEATTADLRVKRLCAAVREVLAQAEKEGWK